ncbi:MAG: DUF998 domain-containing protein [Actinobacteria bacterium]|nr:DUF998 domain-containing protein [Actinomycetota bacterium]
MTSSPSITPGSTGAAPGASYLTAGAPAAGASWLLACGAVAGPLFVTAVLVQAVTRPGFDLTRDAASLLDTGSWGWIQVVNFIVTGLLFIVAGAGLRRALNGGRGSRWAPRLLIITGAGCIGGGIFHPDPSGGFPPGTPPGASAVSSWHGTLHLICGSAAFLALIVFCVVVARRYWFLGKRRTAACSLLAGVLCAAGVATGGIPHGSLTLFIGVSIAMLWIAYLSIQLRAQHAA